MGYEVGKPAGGWVRTQSNRRARRIIAGLVAFFAITAFFVGLAFSHALSIVGSAVFFLTILLIRPLAESYVDKDALLHSGTLAEEAVGRTLEALRHEGWIVMHDIEQQYEGNIDHLVSGPGGVFMIETKARAYRDGQLRKARRQAAKLHDALEVWVTPVICLNERDQRPRKTSGVWIIPRQHLLDWLRAQQNAVLPFERLARFADSL